MKRLQILLAAGLALILTAGLPAADNPPKEKNPGDLAADAFFKLRDDKDATINPARLQKIQAAGFSFLATYPSHARVGSVINAMATFAGTIKDKKQAPLRDYWVSQLSYEIINRRTKSDITDEVRLVFASLDAALAGYDVRASGSKEKLDTLRAKIDRLAEMEGSSRFLAGHEREYVQVLYPANAKLGLAHVNSLLNHPDKKVAAMAQDELNLIELSQQPLELKAATLNGQVFDAAPLRGKVLYFIFWSTTNEASLKELEALRDYYVPYQKLGVEIVTVAHDTDRAALEKFVKDKRYTWPVLFDGEGSKGEFSRRVNARSLPASALFNQQGWFAGVGVRSNKLEAEVIKLGIKRR